MVLYPLQNQRSRFPYLLNTGGLEKMATIFGKILKIVALARVRLAAGGIPVPRRLITAECMAKGKPHPAPFLAGAALLGFAPQECVVFENESMQSCGVLKRRQQAGIGLRLGESPGANGEMHFPEWR